MVGAQERFWAKVDKNGPVVREELGPCWVWLGHRHPKGYGAFSNGTETKAHRAAWIFASGDIPVGMQVLHRCDNPPCVRAEHLFLGTNLDNVRDRVAKGRSAIRRGEEQNGAVLTDAIVLQLRAEARAGTLNIRAKAEEMGVFDRTLSRALYGLGWRHLPGALERGALSADRPGLAKTAAHRVVRGEKHHAAKLTVEDVRAIRDLRESGAFLRVIAEMYKLDITTVSGIVRRKRWKHVA